MENLITTAAEMSALISYFGILMGHLVPEEDLGWELYLLLFDIEDLVMSPIMAQHDIIYLQLLIEQFNKLYL